MLVLASSPLLPLRSVYLRQIRSYLRKVGWLPMVLRRDTLLDWFEFVVDCALLVLDVMLGA